ncbi:hypothetical protein Btru_034840, partial [Bulinus truncatus]
ISDRWEKISCIILSPVPVDRCHLELGLSLAVITPGEAIQLSVRSVSQTLVSLQSHWSARKKIFLRLLKSADQYVKSISLYGKFSGLTWSFAVAMLLIVTTRTFETGIDKGTVTCSREKGSEVLHAEKGDHGIIVSGGYPGNYSTGGKSGLWCQVHIQVCSTCKILLHFQELSFAPCPPQHKHKSQNKDYCHYGCDHIHIFEVDPPYNKVTHRDYFYGNESEHYTSISGNLKIRHCVGNSSVEDGKKFKISYNVSDKKEIFKGVVSQYGDVRGVVKSPNFPHGYAINGESFTFEIVNLDPYGHVRLTFDDWDIAPETKVKVGDSNLYYGTPRTHHERHSIGCSRSDGSG